MRFTVTSTNSSTFASISLHTPVIRTSSAVCVKLSRSLFYFSLFIFFLFFQKLCSLALTQVTEAQHFKS